MSHSYSTIIALGTIDLMLWSEIVLIDLADWYCVYNVCKSLVSATLHQEIKGKYVIASMC